MKSTFFEKNLLRLNCFNFQRKCPMKIKFYSSPHNKSYIIIIVKESPLVDYSCEVFICFPSNFKKGNFST